MRCKFCGAELTDDQTLCSQCGKDNAKDSLDMLRHRVKNMKLALYILLATVLLIAVAVVVVFCVVGGMESDPQQTTGPATNQTTEATIPTDGNPDDATCKGTYTGNSTQLTAEQDTVIATMGEIQLTNGEFNVYYWNTIYDFLSNYGSYAAYFGLDMNKPLDTQLCTMYETPMTWQQMFVTQALDTWRTYQTVALEAQKAGFQLPADSQKLLDNLYETMKKTATENKFDSVEALLLADYGPGCDYDDYKSYMQVCYLATDYYAYLSENLEVSDTEIQAYFDKNAAAMKTTYGFESTRGELISVRHILIQPDKDMPSSGYAEADLEACKPSAQQVYDIWKAGSMTENSFAEAAKEHSKDGNAADGGIYTDVYNGMMVKTFNDWCFDESRQYGDHDMVKTQFGWHIMFFVDRYEGYYPPIVSGARSEKLQAQMDTWHEDNPIDVTYSDILLGESEAGK